MVDPNKYTAVLTVIGIDKPGIIAGVTSMLAENKVNISQTLIRRLLSQF